MLASAIGFLGVFANVLIYQQNKSRELLIYKLISNVLWALHYFLLGGLAAGMIASINIFREIVFINQKKKWAKSKLWLVFFVFTSIFISFITRKNFFSIFPAIASILSVISFGLNMPTLSRYLSFPISICMLTYDIVFGSYLGIINETFTIGSTIFALIKLKNQKQT